jgi:predicted transcriptional regulator of viral defense system
MDITVSENLSKIPGSVMDHATLKSILNNLGYININDKIRKLLDKGILIPLKRGMYLHKPVGQPANIPKEIISNNLLGPSYISLDYALSYRGLIPEIVHTVTAMTTKRSKIFDTTVGVFSYRQIKPAIFGLGVSIEKANSGNFLIAGKEKALCDKIYFTSDYTFTSKRMIQVFLEDDLRIDIDEIKTADPEVILDYYKITKSKKIKLLHYYMMEL